MLKRPLIVAFNVVSLSGWGGGIDFLRMLIQGLIACDKENKIKIYLMIPYAYIWDCRFKRFIKHFIDHCFYRNRQGSYFPSDVKNNIADIVRLFEPLTTVVFYQQNEYESILAKFKADIVLPISPNASLWTPAWPYVGYIFDFQHKYYPEYFSVKEYIERERSFAYLLCSSKAIIVHSLHVKRDIERFYPSYKCQVFDLPFAGMPINEWFSLKHDRQYLEIRYNLPQKYFVICNQFWIHKDHATAFEALAKIADDDIHIVCTGNTQDYRFPDYFNQLVIGIKKLGLTERIHFLGYIPKVDQIGIIRNSLGLIQTTLFEGAPGGASVSDALSLGVPVILSDIPVNRLVDSDNLLFFEAKNYFDLALKMTKLLELELHPASNDFLRDIGQKRIERFGARLLEAIHYIIQKQK